MPLDLAFLPEPCRRRHPGWVEDLDYRHLSDDSPRVRRVSAATPARLIDHTLEPHLFSDVEPFGYLGMVNLATGTLLLWSGSAYEHAAGLVLRGVHVLQVLNGDLRGACVEITVEEVDQAGLPDTMPPAGGAQRQAVCAHARGPRH